MEFGLTQVDIDKLRQVLASFPELEKAIVYGSRAKGNYKPYSDIDLTLIGEMLDLSIQFRIENDIDDLLLPYKMDVSILRQISNPDLVDHIQRIGKIFYEKRSR